MSVLALNGWAQAPEALSMVLPDNASIFSYGEYHKVDDCFAALKQGETAPDVAVGWSLGGQLLVRAVAAKVLQPKRIVLLAAPFQLVSDAHFHGGVPKAMLMASRLALAAAPAKMLEEFQAYMLGKGDSKEEQIHAKAPRYLNQNPHMHWLFWFDELMRYSCRELDFSNFPSTDIIHGTEDAVVPFASGKAFAEHIPHACLHRLPMCGHAPHWHNPVLVSSIICGEWQHGI